MSQKIISFIIIVCGAIIVSLSLGVAFAESYESSNPENYLFLEVNDDKVSGLLRMDGKMVSISSDIKFYNNGNFKIKVFQDRLILYGSFDKLQVIVLDLNIREKIPISIQEIRTERLVPKAQTYHGLPHIETLLEEKEEKRLAELESQRLLAIENKTPRSDYTLSDEEIVILGNMPNKFPYYESMDFDVRVVDTANNPFVKHQSFWNDNMGMDDVLINAKVLDPNGIILNEMSGVTKNKGKYNSEDTNFGSFKQNKPYTILVDAIKYFDDTETYAIASLLSQFYMYSPSDVTPSDRYPPVGSITITNSSVIPEFELECFDYNKRNQKTDGGCLSMIFGINTPDFSNSKLYPYNSTFTWSENVLDEGFYRIYVSFFDGAGNQSIEDIFVEENLKNP